MMRKCGLLVFWLVFGWTDAGADIVSPGYTIGEIATPGIATGGVVAVGESLFVGVGDFGVGTQSVVRIDADGTATALADGFNALSGFAYDPVGNRLLVGDNAYLDDLSFLPGTPETGETLYAIPDPFGTPASARRAVDLELLPAGSVPGLADIILDPADATGQTLLISDAGNFGSNAAQHNVFRLLGSDVSVLQDGFEFTGGLAASGDTLFIGESFFNATPGDPFNTDGRVFAVGLPDGSGVRSLLADGLDGLFALILASDGSLLATAGSTLVRIDPDTGEVEVVASGFEFATGLAESDGVIYAIEGGFSTAGPRVYSFALIPEPATWGMLGLGVLWLGVLRRRSQG